MITSSVSSVPAGRSSVATGTFTNIVAGTGVGAVSGGFWSPSPPSPATALLIQPITSLMSHFSWTFAMASVFPISTKLIVTPAVPAIRISVASSFETASVTFCTCMMPAGAPGAGT